MFTAVLYIIANTRNSTIVHQQMNGLDILLCGHTMEHYPVLKGMKYDYPQQHEYISRIILLAERSQLMRANFIVCR